MMKILLDTDIGTDVDDAVCLAYLLAHPDCELLGITTVTGEAVKRASLASALCKVAGKYIPIFPGAEMPMAGIQRQAVAQQAAALPNWDHASSFPAGRAVAFLRDAILANPGEVTLVTIGPLTNIGWLFSRYPEVADQLEALVIMGGVFNPQSPEYARTEWNVSCDPQATEIVYRTRVPVHRSVGLDVTQQVVMPADAVRRRFTSPLLKPVLDFAEIWFDQFYPAITFHDPLTAATVFSKGICTFSKGQVQIVTGEESVRTVFEPGQDDGPYEVAVTVDPDRYFDHFFEIINQYADTIENHVQVA